MTDPRDAIMANLDRLRLLSADWEFGGPRGFASEIRRLGQDQADIYIDGVMAKQVLRIFDILADTLELCEALGSRGVIDPDYDGPREVESRAPRDPQREAAQDAD